MSCRRPKRSLSRRPSRHSSDISCSLATSDRNRAKQPRLTWSFYLKSGRRGYPASSRSDLVDLHPATAQPPTAQPPTARSQSSVVDRLDPPATTFDDGEQGRSGIGEELKARSAAMARRIPPS